MRMTMLVVSIAAILPTSIAPAEPVPQHIQKHFKSSDYVVIWGIPTRYESDGELEIGDGVGHAGALRWLRFRPGPASVDVLSIEFDDGLSPYFSTWPPDRPTVTVRRAQMKRNAYTALLNDLGIVDAAQLKPIKPEGLPGGIWSASQDIWAYARLTANKKTVLRLDWAGYPGTLTEVERAKPQAAVDLAQEAIEGLDFNPCTLTKEDRAWASAKFARDWRAFRDRDDWWWVRENYIGIIGVVGDEAALPTLRRILEEPPKVHVGEESVDRCRYYAINAVTRLTKKDVRDKPVEEMDLENTRRKVLDLLGVDVGKTTSPAAKGTPN